MDKIETEREPDTGEIEIKESIPTKQKVAFGIVGMSVSMLSNIGLGSAITFFYNIKMSLSEELTSLAWIIFMVWNAVNDPLFGILEEKTSTKIGRRIPYIRYGSPFFALTFIFCWFPIVDGQIGLFFNLLLVLFLFDSTFTMIGLITYTLPAEMSITQEGRTEISKFNIIFSAIGMLIAMVIPMVLLTGEDTDELHPAFRPAMIILGIIACVLMYIFSYRLTENKYAAHEETLGFIDSIKETFKNKAFLIFEANNFFYQIAWTILTSSMTYYVQYVMGMTGFMASLPLLVVFLMVFIFIIPFSNSVGKHGLKKVYIYGLGFAAASFIVLFAAQRNEIFIFIGLALIGIGFAPLNLTTGPLMQDVIDYDEVLTGKRRETTYAGMNALIVKPSISIGNAVFLLTIKAFGFDNEITTQSPTAQFGIILAYTIIPCAMLLIASIAIRSFPLEGKKWQKQKARLSEIHEKKEKEFIMKLKEEHPDAI